MQRALGFDRSPPLAVALRFFLNVPVFLMLAAIVLAWLGVAPHSYTRWNTGVLATTHLLVLGVLASAMLGALMQILPVASFIEVLHVRIISPIVHALLSGGVLALAIGFIAGSFQFHAAAVLLLGLAFIIFFIAVAGGMLRHWDDRSPGSGEMLVAVRLALVALFITVALGIFLAGIRAGFWAPDVSGVRGAWWLPRMPDIHVLWGLTGWVGLLVAGISYQVIPIFQATEIYPRYMTDHLTPLIFGVLTILTVSSIMAGNATPSMASVAAKIAGTLLAVSYLVYGMTTAWLLWTRKRPAPEPTTWFWHIAMVSLILATLVGLGFPWITHMEAIGGPTGKVQMLLGSLLVLGFGVSAVNGMLYKIIPFLLWHNAQRRAPVALQFMPKVRDFIAERAALRQCVTHFIATILLIGASLAPMLLLPGAIALAVSAGLLGHNFAKALQLYLVTCRRIDEY